MEEPTGADRGGPAPASARLAADVADVVRDEARAVREDLTDVVLPVGVGLVCIGAAAGCAMLGLGAASAALLRMVERMLPKPLAPVGLAAGYFAAAGVLGAIGVRRLRAAEGDWRQFAEQLRLAASGPADHASRRRAPGVRAAGSPAERGHRG